jgi:hypothetical protein
MTFVLAVAADPGRSSDWHTHMNTGAHVHLEEWYQGASAAADVDHS